MNDSRLFGYLAAISLLAMFVISVGPLLMLPFVNVLPYLQTQSLLERLLWSVSLWSLACVLWFFASTSRQKHLILLALRGWKNMVASLLGVVMFVCSSAFLSANMLGLLVKVFPGGSYEARFEIAVVAYSGVKYKAVDLDLKSLQGDGMCYLTLSKILFDYPMFQAGQVLLLKGKRNLFGVYVEEFAVEAPRAARH